MARDHFWQLVYIQVLSLRFHPRNDVVGEDPHLIAREAADAALVDYDHAPWST